MSFVIRTAEDYYLPPPHLPPTAWETVPPAELAIRQKEAVTHMRLGVPPRSSVVGSTYAYVNHGRWVADCPCGSAQLVSPADPALYCIECTPGGWLSLLFPSDIAAVEQEVAPLPMHERNWRSDNDPELVRYL